MWPDNETDRDFLNFSPVADTVAEMICQAQGRPISIGLSGEWGTGKSSMLKLVRGCLQNRAANNEHAFLYVEFNAWLYQGFDDARAALIDQIARELGAYAQLQKSPSAKAIEKTKDLLKRVNWIRAAKLASIPVLAATFGVMPPGAIGELWAAGKEIATGKVNKEGVDAAVKAAEGVGATAAELLSPKTEESPPAQIAGLRKSFEESLNELKVTLVVLIDDLDRCLPETTISTLEAVRLFLFLERTAFVVAADTKMIKHAVRKHFELAENEDELTTSYFDKLVQIPVRVPSLGTQEVRAYLMLLYLDDSNLDSKVKEDVRAKVISQLRLTWQGKRVDQAFFREVCKNLPAELLTKLDTAERLAPLMITASKGAGNPRLVKRFLNAVAIRVAIAKAHDVPVDEAVLAKLLLYERYRSSAQYAELMSAVNTSERGWPEFLAELEDGALKDLSPKLPEPWNDQFAIDWLRLPPRLADQDLRGALYVSKEHALITPEIGISSEAAELLDAILEQPDMAGALKDRIALLQKPEINIIMSRLLERARQQKQWGAEPILEACLVVAGVDALQGDRLATFLATIPPKQIKASLIPKIEDQVWADDVFNAWPKQQLSTPVKRAIEQRRNNGHL
ncbi:MAG TPA: P-loop NTPase fold protein [Terriglobales bacterium]